MAALTKTQAVTSLDEHLRPFDARRDLQAVADLIELCFAQTLDPDGKQYLQRMRSTARNAGLLRWAAAAAEWASVSFTGFVWQEGERLVGNASLIPFYVRGRRQYMIANVAVHPEYRCRGIGRRLTEKAVEYVRQRRHPCVWLSVREENTPAVNLYRSLGFMERTRRTTWYSENPAPHSNPSHAFTIAKPRARDWTLQRLWLLKNYPCDYAWHMNFNPNNLRPGWIGAVHRLFNDAWVHQWAALQGTQFLGAVAWQYSSAHANYLWLAAPPDADKEVVRSLLIYARNHSDGSRPLMLEYPALQSTYAIQEAGFYAQQTLIWMSLSLNP